MSRKPRKRITRAPLPPQRIDEARLAQLDRVFPGVAAFYRANYDEQGRCMVQFPGLRRGVEQSR